MKCHLEIVLLITRITWNESRELRLPQRGREAFFFISITIQEIAEIDGILIILRVRKQRLKVGEITGGQGYYVGVV